MVSKKENLFEPIVTPPSDIVVDYLEFYGWSQRDLARRTGLTPKTISEICSGKASITPATALAFENVFQRPAHFWLNLQRQFDEAEARALLRSKYEEWETWAKKFPVAEIKRYRWLDNTSKGSSVDILLNFFGVSSPKSWNSVWEATNISYRQTRKFSTSSEAVSVWIRATEIMAENVEKEVRVSDFDENILQSHILELRNQTRKRPENFVHTVQHLCASAGVIVVWVPEIKQTGISGCARWLTDKKALVALTLRYKTDDQMWFTFFHEIAHLLLHRKEKNFILDNAAESLDDQIIDPQMRKREEEANRYAADTLIPPEALYAFILKSDYSSEAILSASEQLGIGPGILVGRLQKEEVLRYNQGNGFKQIFDWEFSE
jgi:addiction module HigA family antidote